MKIEIRVGDVTTNKRVKYSTIKNDDINSEKKLMYDFLSECKDCIVENVDNFLLYTLNNGLMAHIVKDNPKLNEIEYSDEECNLIPKFNPNYYRVVEVKNDGSEVSLQDKDGNISKNYFNMLMSCIMDDYFSCLNFYEPSIEAQK
jgi:hypothetical protein